MTLLTGDHQNDTFLAKCEVGQEMLRDKVLDYPQTAIRCVGAITHCWQLARVEGYKNVDTAKS